MKSFRDIRVIPVLLVAIFSLAVLKIAGLVLDGAYVFDYDPRSTKRSWAQENLNFPGKEDVDITGSTHGAPKEAKKEEAPAPAAPDVKPDGIVIHPEEIGVQLTEGMMMEPEASVSAMVFHHPDCSYFTADEEATGAA